MPKELTDKLVWLFLLLPGFLCVSVIGLIVDFGRLSEFQITFYSFILTLVIALLSLPLTSLVARLFDRMRRGSPLSAEGRMIAFFSISSVAAVLLGIFLGLAAEGDRFFLTLRSLPITDTMNKRSSNRPFVFLLSQNSAGKLKEKDGGDARPADMKQTEAWARVRLKDGVTYEGWPEFYSVSSTPAELYLSPACRVNIASGVESVDALPGPGVILKEAELVSLEFIDGRSSLCFAKFQRAKPTP